MFLKHDPASNHICLPEFDWWLGGRPVLHNISRQRHQPNAFVSNLRRQTRTEEPVVGSGRQRRQLSHAGQIDTTDRNKTFQNLRSPKARIEIHRNLRHDFPTDSFGLLLTGDIDAIAKLISDNIVHDKMPVNSY